MLDFPAQAVAGRSVCRTSISLSACAVLREVLHERVGCAVAGNAERAATADQNYESLPADVRRTYKGGVPVE